MKPCRGLYADVSERGIPVDSPINLKEDFDIYSKFKIGFQNNVSVPELLKGMTTLLKMNFKLDVILCHY